MHQRNNNAPMIGMANSSFAQQFLRQHPEVLDFVEIPYEQLLAKPETVIEFENIPKILHCASLAVSASDPPSNETIDNVKKWAGITRTPWIGEHIAFVHTPGIGEGSNETPDTDGNIFHGYNIGYTAAPIMTEQTLDDTINRVNQLQSRFSVPLILENPPIYFTTPGSTMNQFEFMKKLTERSNINLLFDLAHFFVTCQNLDLNIINQIDSFPTDRIIEVHISGVTNQSGLWWDDHALPASENQFKLLTALLDRCAPKAITLEYNWQTNFPHDTIISQVNRIRSIVVGD
jgi:uncharacterized protein (UPF0276 family)